MIIHKIKMINFRCFQNKTIDFENKSVVLLSAANGIGKTTTIDAIEWCLTGNIGRLKTTFDTRSTNEADRRMNTDGILKNRNAKSKENIIVSLWLYDGEKERILCAVFYGNDAAGYRYVIGSRTQDLRAFSKMLNAAFEGRGGGKPEMVQGTVKGEAGKIREWIQKIAEELSYEK